MVNIEKKNTDLGNKIIITKDFKTLSLLHSKENDLYISLFDREYPYNINIDLSDGNLYCIIDKLYNDIKKINYFYNTNLNDIERSKINNLTEENKLFKDNTIDYHSDDESYENSSRLLIIKNIDNYLIELESSKDLNDNSVVISNVNSRYNNANLVFMRFYEELNNLDFKTRKLTK